MENHDFDKQISQKLQAAAVAPPEFVWPRVKESLHSRRRRFWLLLPLGGLLLLTVLLSLAVFYPRISDTHSPQPEAQLHIASDQQPLEKQGYLIENQEIKPERVLPESSVHQRAAFHANKSDRQQLPKKKPDSPENLPQYPSDAAFVPTVSPTARASVEPTVETLTPVFFAEPERIPTLRQPLPMPARPQPGFAAPPIKKLHRNKQYKTHRWEGYTAATYTQSVLRARSDAFIPHQQQRAAAENYVFGAAVGVRSCWVRQHFVLRLGLNYTQFTERFDYAASGVARVSDEHEIVYIDGVAHNRLRTVTTFGELRQTIYNRFGMLEAPVMIGFEKRHGKWNIGAHIGANANVVFWKKGKILNPQPRQNDLLPTHTDLSSAMQGRILGNYECAVQVSYKLKPGIRIFGEPYFQSSMQSVSASSNPVEQVFRFWGLRLGLAHTNP